jgi:1,4-alpha-glucan branching enzyme
MAKEPEPKVPAAKKASRKDPKVPVISIPELHPDHVAALIEGRHPRPHDALGQHQTDDGFVIRAVRPLARTVTAVRADGSRVPLTHASSGLWHGIAPGAGQAYVLEATYDSAPDWTTDDPYRFVSSVGEIDLYLWGQGRHEQLWQVFGSHYRPHEGVEGTSFSVWAPHATAARVVGDFNGWNGAGHAMRRLDDNGVWEIFIPGLTPGNAYKFELRTAAGEWVSRADPMARYTEVPPATASKVGQTLYEWSDDAWLAERASKDPHNSAMSVYEMHVGSWRPGLGYRELADELIGYIHETGYTHVEFMPLAEHPFGGSWGYQVTGYYAPTSRFGHPDDLRYLIDRLHQAGIGVIMDWVPAHFPKDEWALAKFDGQPLYELEDFHIDGLRVDAVASMLYLDYSREPGEWLPNVNGGRENLEAISFLQEVNATAYKRNPGVVMIAEESTAWSGVTRQTSSAGLGFGLKWNMGWMHDSLSYMEEDPMYRSYHHNEITFSMVYAYTESFLLPISHDEVVHGKGSLLAKMPGDQWQKLANLRAYLSFMWAHPGKQLLFMGQDFGQPSEWSEQRGLDWWILDQPIHRGLLTMVSQMNRVYRDEAPLWSRDNDPDGFEWLDAGDAEHNVVSFLRWDNHGNPVAVLMNFSGAPVGPYRVGLPFAGTWDEILNTDAAEYGGSGVGNYGAVTAVDEPWGGRPASAELTLPPLAGLWLKLRK